MFILTIVDPDALGWVLGAAGDRHEVRACRGLLGALQWLEAARLRGRPDADVALLEEWRPVGTDPAARVAPGTLALEAVAWVAPAVRRVALVRLGDQPGPLRWAQAVLLDGPWTAAAFDAALGL